ncbi:hypothetical protein [uncultured Shewanella sp.]|uniref:hypothetical protein n=1 Tax=uncultured Shewanella sp. TaxID=173975 RepID=UPI00260A022C|nr:hypothetical protein [uncultured Shewanella sp.]
MLTKISINSNDDCIYIENDKIISFDNDVVAVTCEIEQLKIVRYLSGLSLKCDKWSISVNESAAEKLIELGLELVDYNEVSILTTVG